MSIYRYVTTDLLSGTLLADTLPLHVSDFSRNLGGVGQPGTFSGILDLGVIGGGNQSAYLGALEPRKTLLWALQDNYPIWCGPVWDWPHQSARADQLPIEGRELHSLFGSREIRTNQVMAIGTDLFTVFRSLLTYTLSKTNGGVAQLQLGTNLSGVTLATGYTFDASNSQKVLDALDQFAVLYNFEYAFTPSLDVNGNLIVTLQLGYPTLTRTVANTNLLFQYPGNVLDYGYPRNGSASINNLLVTANSAGSIPWKSGATHGQNSADLTAGYPLLEGTLAYTTSPITTQAQIDAVADGKIPMRTGTATVPTVTVGGGQTPVAGQIQLGDEANFAATSTLHPANFDGSPGLQTKVRVIGWTVHPPSDTNQQSETTDYALGGIVT